MQIVEWMTPIANYLKDLPAGWTIPIGGSVRVESNNGRLIL